MPGKCFPRLVGDIREKPIKSLKTEEINLFNFLTLIVDIKHRVKYGCSLQGMNDIEKINTDNLPDQLFSVDNDLEGVSRRRVSDAS
jgi:hypothetical protein